MNIRFKGRAAVELDNYMVVGGPLDGRQYSIHKGTLRLVWGDPDTRRVFEYEVEDVKLIYVKEVKEWLKN